MISDVKKITRNSNTRTERWNSIHQFVRSYECGRLSGLSAQFHQQDGTDDEWDTHPIKAQYDATKADLERQAAVMLGYWDLAADYVEKNPYTARMAYLRHQVYWWDRYNNTEWFSISDGKLYAPITDTKGHPVTYSRPELSPDDVQLINDRCTSNEVRSWLNLKPVVRVRKKKRLSPELIAKVQAAIIAQR